MINLEMEIQYPFEVEIEFEPDVDTTHLEEKIKQEKGFLELFEYTTYEIQEETQISKNLQNIGPVSYTHLDVYKRQPLGRCSYKKFWL